MISEARFKRKISEDLFLNKYSDGFTLKTNI